MVTRPNPASPSSNGNHPDSLHGIRIGLGIAFLTACAFCFLYLHSAAVQHDRANKPLPAWVDILSIAFLILPFLVCLSLISTRQHKSIAVGAGVAFASFG